MDTELTLLPRRKEEAICVGELASYSSWGTTATCQRSAAVQAACVVRKGGGSVVLVRGALSRGSQASMRVRSPCIGRG